MPARSVSLSNENDRWILAHGKSVSQVVNDSLDKVRLERNLLSDKTLLAIKKYSAEMSVTGGVINQRSLVEQAVINHLNQISFIGNMSSNTGMEKIEEKQDSNS